MVDNYFQGVIDQVQFYSFGVSAADAADMYSTGGGADGGYMAKYTFDGNAVCRRHNPYRFTVIGTG
jgi:hypothetical protein